jgi:hypothetical protein
VWVPDPLELLADDELVSRLNTAAATRGLTLLMDERDGEWHATLHPVYSVHAPDRRTAMIRLAMMVEHEDG